jgi:hypothetical protein
LAYFDLFGVCPHLFDLAHILFYLTWIWREFIRRRVAYLEGHTCGFCMHTTWYSFYSWRLFLEGAHVEDFFLYFWKLSWRVHLWRLLFSILGFDHILSCGVLHLVGTLHIHPWSFCTLTQLLWITFYSLRRCLWSILLGGLLYYLIIHASWRVSWMVHLVSSSRWTLKHILLC